MWHTVAVLDMTATHDTDDQRLLPITPRASDRLGHGAVPKQLGANETLERL